MGVAFRGAEGLKIKNALFRIVGIVILGVIITFCYLGLKNKFLSPIPDKLSASECIPMPSAQMLDDELGWITNKQSVIGAMDDFYESTGVQPYLLICNNLGGKGGDITEAEAEGVLSALYKSKFNDEGHMILAFMEYETSLYIPYIYTGEDAEKVIDDRSKEIILDTINSFYTDTSLTDDEYFIKIFDDSAYEIIDSYKVLRIVQGFSFGCILADLIIALLHELHLIIKVKEMQAEKQEEKLKVVLDTPVNELSDDFLKEKYKR